MMPQHRPISPIGVPPSARLKAKAIRSYANRFFGILRTPPPQDHARNLACRADQLREARPAKVDELCRRRGVSTAAFYAWRKKFGGMEASDATKLRDLEAENARQKRIVADQMLDTAPWRAMGRSDNGAGP